MARQSQAERPSKSSSKSLLRVAGLPAVSALFAIAPARVERLFFDQRLKPHVAAFCAELARARKPYRLVEADELERVAGSVMHGGIVALAQPKPVPILDPAQADAKAEAWARERKLLLMLDGIGNPHNLGAIVRTAAFFGVPRIVLSDHPAQALPSDASYRVAEGGLEFVELYRAQRFAQVLARLRKSHRIVAASAEDGQPLATLSPGAFSGKVDTGFPQKMRPLKDSDEKPFALILGNEERGLARATLDACDAIVTIPGAGHVQSLNVAASAAILIHALAQR